MSEQQFRRGTLAVRGGVHPTPNQGIVPPVDFSTTFVLPGDAKPGDYSYGRGNSPSFQPLERALADIEGGTDSVVFNAGMSAAVALMDEAKPGTAMVISDDVYYGIRVYAQQTLASRGVEVRPVDMRDLGALEQALDGATFLWTETPTNPHLGINDLAAIGALCADKGVPWAVDNTFASPVLQQPLQYGAVASMHSLTKYVGGHSDLILGAAIVNDAELAARLRSRRGSIGTQPDPFSAWLARRGLQTLFVRVRHQCLVAMELATRLGEHPNVDRVYYPGLASDTGHDIAKRQMVGGFGGILSMEVKGDGAAAQRVLDAVQVWIPATSLGSVESLIERRAKWTGEIAKPNLLRMSVGLEDIEDLWGDLDQALRS